MGLRDLRAKVAIARRIEQAENGNLARPAPSAAVFPR